MMKATVQKPAARWVAPDFQAAKFKILNLLQAKSEKYINIKASYVISRRVQNYEPIPSRPKSSALLTI